MELSLSYMLLYVSNDELEVLLQNFITDLFDI